MDWKPFDKYVQVKYVDQGERVSEGGILLASSVRTEVEYADVVAVSESVMTPQTGEVRRPRVRKGQKVMVVAYGGADKPGLPGPDGTRLITEDDIVCICDQ